MVGGRAGDAQLQRIDKRTSRALRALVCSMLWDLDFFRLRPPTAQSQKVLGLKAVARLAQEMPVRRQAVVPGFYGGCLPVVALPVGQETWGKAVTLIPCMLTKK